MPRTQPRIAQTRIAFKDSCRAATESNIADLGAGAPNTVDGVSVAQGDRILVKSQTSAPENGIYQVDTVGTGADGSWSRVDDLDADSDIDAPCMLVMVVEGTVNSLEGFLQTNLAAAVVGTDALNWAMFTSVGEFDIGDVVPREVPSGAIDNSNTTYTLANTPEAGSEEVYLNGLLQNEGAGNDYTISGATITMLDAPKSGDVILVSYWKQQ